MYLKCLESVSIIFNPKYYAFILKCLNNGSIFFFTQNNYSAKVNFFFFRKYLGFLKRKEFWTKSALLKSDYFFQLSSGIESYSQ